eukprot:TRINITY_DN442_c0_g1_i1.p1 TRINITY_DN442_c0_g1~~TRINITY_DN442_c0_g1_i1.p1  ORF type:complete len:150 (-),score=43.46 TRINITY_DN442_c0_g1_i1:32-427(-)
MTERKYVGGCHCGGVRFEVEAAENIEALDCNCTVCNKKGFLHLIVPKSKFNLLTPEENMGLYTWGTGVAKHYFCKTCGISSWYIPRSNPDGIDINVRCLEDVDLSAVKITPFNGRGDWDKSAAQIEGLSKE